MSSMGRAHWSIWSHILVVVPSLGLQEAYHLVAVHLLDRHHQIMDLVPLVRLILVLPYHRRWSHWSIRSGPAISGGGPIGPSGPGPRLRRWSHQSIWSWSCHITRRWSHWSIKTGPISPGGGPIGPSGPGPAISPGGGPIGPPVLVPYHQEVGPIGPSGPGPAISPGRWSIGPSGPGPAISPGGGPIGPSGPGPYHLVGSSPIGPGPAISPGGGPPCWRWSHWSVWSWYLTGRWSHWSVWSWSHHLVVHHRMLRQHFHLLHQKHLVA